MVPRLPGVDQSSPRPGVWSCLDRSDRKLDGPRASSSCAREQNFPPTYNTSIDQLIQILYTSKLPHATCLQLYAAQCKILYNFNLQQQMW
ncbi:RNase E specificity factor CsrD [Trichinella spiralis]|uniref:RNase E specificity factor CsrD n=1 Tax=Trichinella spiralis TaxID=6334 RepID=A0ABR3KA80_TRISP